MPTTDQLRRANTDEPATLRTSIARKCVWLLLLAAMLAVSACGFRWWYGQAGLLLERRINQYIDLSNEQRRFIRPRLQAHLEWHRIEVIPQHLAFLERTRDGIQDGVSVEEIHWFFNEYRRQIHLLIGQLAHDSVQLLKTLTPAQIDHFEKRLVEGNQEYEEQRAMSAEKRLERRAERIIKELADWLGSLSREQEKAIFEMSRALPDNFDDWYQERLERQRFFIQTLHDKADDSAIEAAFFGLMNVGDPDQPASAPPVMIAMVLTVDRLTTPSQRRNVTDKLQSWINDLRHVYERR